MPSTVEQGNAFRDEVARTMNAAGWEVEATESRQSHIKVDTVVWSRLDNFGEKIKLLIETKDHATVTKVVTSAFIADYGSLVGPGKFGAAWLVSKQPISADARAQVESHAYLRALDFTMLQRRLFNVDQLIEGALRDYASEGVDGWFNQPRIASGGLLIDKVKSWLDAEGAEPLAVIGPYGTGKTTFALYLASVLAAEAIEDTTKRVPLRVPLAEVYDDQSMEGLFGKLLASGENRVPDYHYRLFQELNSAGRFVLIFDGFDEMKHGMTIQTFERNVNRLLTLDHGRAKIIILGRDTAIHDEHEFRAIIGGVQRTTHGQSIRSEGRRAFEALELIDFTIPEAHTFVQRFLPAQVARQRGGLPNGVHSWVTDRVSELTSGTFDELLVRPVHARMLCQVASAPDITLTDLTRFGLYDLFVHYLVAREADKAGRSDKFDRECRRRFNAAVAWWLWEQGGASTCTLGDIPERLIQEASTGIQHGFNDIELKRELTSGLLVEKREGEIIYFSHRSIQEFLVAEHLVRTDLLQSGISASDLKKVLPLLTEVVLDFLMQRLELETDANTASKWLQLANRLTGSDVDIESLELFRYLAMFEGALVAPGAWRPVLEFIVGNNAASFRITDERARKTLFSILDLAQTSTDVAEKAACLMLAARIARESGDQAIMSYMVAVCLPEFSVSKALTEIGAKGSGYRHQVQRDSDLLLWTFLRSVQVRRSSSGERAIVINADQIETDMGEVTGYSFKRPAETSLLIAPLGLVYALPHLTGQQPPAFDVRSVRAMLENAAFSAKMMPLIVERVPSVSIDAVARRLGSRSAKSTSRGLGGLPNTKDRVAPTSA